VDDFATFWASYPRKVGKFMAHKAYIASLKHASAEEILAGVERSKRGWTDPKFIPYPATWLRAGRWMDEDQPQPVAREWKPWRCPHLEQCGNPGACANADILGRARKSA
jgi:hypothetical protein